MILPRSSIIASTPSHSKPKTEMKNSINYKLQILTVQKESTTYLDYNILI